MANESLDCDLARAVCRYIASEYIWKRDLSWKWRIDPEGVLFFSVGSTIVDELGEDINETRYGMLRDSEPTGMD